MISLERVQRISPASRCEVTAVSDLDLHIRRYPMRCWLFERKLRHELQNYGKKHDRLKAIGKLVADGREKVTDYRDGREKVTAQAR